MAAREKTVMMVEELREWMKSPEGQAAHAEAKRLSRERTRFIREAYHCVDPEFRKFLRKPMTI